MMIQAIAMKNSQPLSKPPQLAISQPRFAQQEPTEKAGNTLADMSTKDILQQVAKLKKAELPETKAVIQRIENSAKWANRYTAVTAGVVLGTMLFELVGVVTLMPLVPIIAAPFFVLSLIALLKLTAYQHNKVSDEYSTLTKKLGLAPDFKELPNTSKSLTTA